jgi:hypothetical protein
MFIYAYVKMKVPLSVPKIEKLSTVVGRKDNHGFLDVFKIN